ncbi:unnamed protein product [Didymodactylos carnosus]|uniref:Endonuclease/exonuclease/phosphatase domain-containing protein n=2 Tax=Didymodactylos carnosus TaxID=1234261 RepID=A0A8S2I6B2_9BILA|nr:unnamed protein product [Didymodactylos carnosus]CAF3702274.1 unnamed protein product [Didymodactylos carnosus]
MADVSNRIPVWYYDKVRHYWTAKDSTMFRPRKPFSSDSLRIITYNIWFKKTHQPSRFNHLNALLYRSDAHIICLQESKQIESINNEQEVSALYILATKYVLEQLISLPWIQHRYILSDVDGRTFLYSPRSYGVVMLIDKHLSLRELSMYPLPTRKGRQFLLAKIQLRNERFLVGTAHLESLRNSQDLRSQQLQLCQSIFDRHIGDSLNVTGFFMGDFNFGAHWRENTIQMNILQGWTDLWPELKGPDDRGITHTNVRFDRMMFRSSHVRPTKIRIIGKKPIAEAPPSGNQLASERDVFISDHFGLKANFDLSFI